MFALTETRLDCTGRRSCVKCPPLTLDEGLSRVFRSTPQTVSTALVQSPATQCRVEIIIQLYYVVGKMYTYISYTSVIHTSAHSSTSIRV
uniref:AlNc14C2560G13257 protein n=1 Tax=Albugo laibachii Nc14 TaxID=890382 RepID=F0X2Y5_9STRA|nr:AlNc14C2560G13257 [Albugo laibachii Nc14]|eukprot:CCA28356.1 AlNc14C2560G13257 [Albugo laibachii Nc14]